MSTATTWLTLKVRIAKPDRLPYSLLAAWVVAMITLPILRWLYGDDAIPAGVTLSALFQVVAVIVLLAGAWGVERVAVKAALILAAAWAVEYVGSHTGVPFGAYTYTARLQPQVGDVPLLIPLAWLMMLPPAWAVAQAITRRSSGAAFVLVSAVAFTAWDLFLDPQMVAWDFWRWANPVGYFGVPWVNFAGWLAASALITWAARPSAVPMRPLLGIYAITWALETVGQLVFWGLPGSALVGFVAMGGLLVAAVRAQRERHA